MWAKVKGTSRQARLLAFFNRLANKDKGLVLKVLEVIYKENQGISGDSLENDFCIENSNTDNPLNCTHE
jgi:hypothetical protein